MASAGLALGRAVEARTCGLALTAQPEPMAVTMLVTLRYYSARSAMFGSTAAARRAGMKLAASATPSMVTMTLP